MRMTTNVRTSVLIGLTMASLYSLYAMVLYAVRGNEPFDANEVSVSAIVLAYYGGGLIGGAIAGLLWPLVRWRVGATLVGAVVAFFLFLGIIAAMDGTGAFFRSESYLEAAVIGTLVGGVAANLTWRKPT